MTATPGHQERERVHFAAPTPLVFGIGGMRNPEVDLGQGGAGVVGIPHKPSTCPAATRCRR
ncbi:MAG: hypothetical protein NTV38_12085 [Chloroflexi bacterium]|nr:hypothetical protein [Chloroflexota bacterium]